MLTVLRSVWLIVAHNASLVPGWHQDRRAAGAWPPCYTHRNAVPQLQELAALEGACRR